MTEPAGGGEDPLAGVRRAVAVCAHPDDESFGLGAVITTLTARGATVDLVCLTRGEASSLGAVTGPLDSVRVEELEAACRVLGIGQVTVGAFSDGALDAAPSDSVARFIEPLAVGADTLLVFDETGITGHPDHRAATNAALQVAKTLGIQVLAWTIPQQVADRLNAELATGFIGRRPTEIDLTVKVDRRRQRAAIACHRSQLQDNPIPLRRLALTGDVEFLRLTRRPGPGKTRTQLTDV